MLKSAGFVGPSGELFNHGWNAFPLAKHHPVQRGSRGAQTGGYARHLGEVALQTGDTLITMMVDQGGRGEDIMHTEAVKNLPVAEFDTDGNNLVDCNDQPALFASVVDRGDFRIVRFDEPQPVV